MSSYLNLNKDKIKKSVVCKLSTLGYKVDEDTSVRDIQEIVKMIQRDNGLMIDGCIGRRTMPLLGYSGDEIRKMLKLPKNTNGSSYDYPIWLLFC
jgi:murein L,D-transpeptidase YcbB/YkuD